MQKSRYLLLLLVGCALLLTQPLYAQLGMGGKPHASAALDVQSTNKAFYPPRLTTTQRNAIADPQPGALVFDTDKGGLYLYDGTNWMVLAFTTPEGQFSNQVNAGDGVSGDKFGYSVAISGDYAIIGAVGDATNQGSAYIFKRSDAGWAQQSKLTASDGSASDFFGYSVAIDGTHAIVGAYRDSESNYYQGSAYFFYRSGNSWLQQEKVTASDANRDDNFGFCVFISGSYAIVGAPGNDISGKVDQGAAYIFTWSGIDLDPFVGYVNWTQQEQLLAGDGLAGDEFGRAVAIAGDYAIIGVPGDDNTTITVVNNTTTTTTITDQGSAYVYLRNGTSWNQQAKLVASNGKANDQFGYSVGIGGGAVYAIVGAPNRDKTTPTVVDAGAAYVYQRSGTSWGQEYMITAADGEQNDYFGISVGITAINGIDRAIVGANGKNVGTNAGTNNNQGVGYVYYRFGGLWLLDRKLMGVSGASAANGRSVDISGNYFVIGAPGFNSSTGKVTFGSVDN